MPPGFVIPTAAHSRALVEAGLGVRPAASGGAAHRAKVATMPLPSGWAEVWVEAARALGDRVAVRSSGLSEDGATRSLAGAHASVIGVAPEDVPDAVLTVWASRWSEAATASGGETGMAVLVQAMVPAEASGVLFTIDPTTGSWREARVEAVWGLGEALVGGHVPPQSWVVRRPRHGPVGPLGLRMRARVTVLSSDPVDADRWWPASGGGAAPLPDDLRGRAALSHHDVRALVRLGLRVESKLGGPQDIEWARDAAGELWVVQARPITASAAPHRPATPLWTRRFLGERFHRPVTPLGWSVLEPILSWFIAYPDVAARHLGGGPALRLVAGRPYVDATVFRHLAFKLPGAPPPEFVMEMLPRDEAQAWRLRRAGLPGLRVLAAIAATTWSERRWHRFAWDPTTNPADWDRFEAALERDLARGSTPASDVRASVRRVEEQTERLRAYVGVHVVSLLFAHLTRQGLEMAVRAACPDRADELMAALATSPPGNPTLRMHHDLGRLARAATAEDRARLADGLPAEGPFALALAGFLVAHGARSESSWELLAPRWEDDPRPLAGLLSTHSLDDQPARERAHADAVATLIREAPWWSVPTLLAGVHWVRTYLGLRERQRWAFERLTQAMRREWMVIGASLVREGRLDAAQDVAFVRWDVLRAAALGDDAVPLRAIAKRARADADAWAKESPAVDLDEVAGLTAPTARLLGRAVSSGRARGTVRVLRRVEDGAKLRPGDVLVASALDPGWTPLLHVASAVVVELGGALSHGAIVARELGVPMVGDVALATSALHDGDEVVVDGRRGEVWRVSPLRAPSGGSP